MRRRDLLALGLAALPAAAAAAGQRHSPNTRSVPIRLVVPFPPGGVYDAVGRPWADRMKPLLGTVVVENIGGAGGSLGAAAVARAQPDGYTILLGGGGALVINPSRGKPRRRTIRSRISSRSRSWSRPAFAIVVHPSLPVDERSSELIDYAKANPGKLSYGSAGVGSHEPSHRRTVQVADRHADIVHVPYTRRRARRSPTSSAGRSRSLVPSVTGQVIELHRAGKLRMLAVTHAEPSGGAPDIPTAVEAGLPGHDRAELHRPVRAGAARRRRSSSRSRRRRSRVMADEPFQRSLIASGFEPEPAIQAPEKTRHFVEDEIARWTPVIKSIGLKLD